MNICKFIKLSIPGNTCSMAILDSDVVQAVPSRQQSPGILTDAVVIKTLFLLAIIRKDIHAVIKRLN